MKEKGLKFIVSGAIAAAASYFGTMIVPLAVLGIVMASDYITGVVAAWCAGELSSTTGWHGIVKKVCYLFAVAVGTVVDYVSMTTLTEMNADIESVHIFGLLVTVWLILNEVLSILENLDKIGVPLPKWLKVVVDRLVGKVEWRGDVLDPINQISENGQEE